MIRNTSILWLPGLALLVVLLAGCVTEYPDGVRSPYMEDLKFYSAREVHDFKPIMTRYNLDPPLSTDLIGPGEAESPDLFTPFHRYSKMRYLGDDGTITMHYYLEAGAGGRIATLLVDLIQDLEKVKDSTAKLGPNQVTVFPNFIIDNRRTAGVGTTTFSNYGAGEKRNACDLLVVKSVQGKLMEVEETIGRLLTEIPQIEIKVRVIEVKLQDRLEYGINSLIYKESTGQPFLNTLFQTDELTGEFLRDESGNLIYESGGWLTQFDTESVVLGGQENFQGSLFEVSGVHDKLVLNALIQLVQKTSESQILSAPEITVLNGHKAVIETGTKVPVQEVETNVNETKFKYKYENTGVKLVILPTLFMDSRIQIEVNGEVTTISGQESVETNVGTVNIPIFTTRNISNIVTVKDGEAFFLGGLLARSEIEQVSKVPLLGDIPILGYLFKTKSTELRETQIIFYIEPHIVKPEEALYMPES
ncbi:MAG: type II secretion system protein GspD [Planctomycetota bacterium]|jgi:type II secretory pathway component GspD/PulD (secretin)